MEQDRKNKVFDRMLSWVFEHVKNDKELFRILHEEFGMTQEEFHDNGIDSLDYLFEAHKIDDTVGKIAVVHLHQEDEDYHFTSEYNNTFFKAAKLYQRFREHGAQASIDPLTFSVLANAIEHDDRVNVVIKIDMDEDMMSVLDKSGAWKTYCLDDILQALGVVERNAGRKVNQFTDRMFRELMDWNEVDAIQKNSEVEEAETSETHIPAM